VRYLIPIILVSLILTSSCTIQQPDIDVGGSTSVVVLSDGEHKLVKWVKRTRKHHHAGDVKVVQSISNQGVSWAQELAADGVLSHHRVRWPGCWGQIVGYGPWPYAVFTAFMNSREHRRIILDRSYEHVGVGVVKSGPHRIWVVMNFGC
jgi:uncharacterized protein YkwD